MPHIIPTARFAFDVCTSARDVTPVAIAAMELDPVQANLILPHLLKCRAGHQKDVGNLWVVVYSSEARSEVFYIAASTRSPIGEYPLFIFTTQCPDQLSDEVLSSDMFMLATRLFDVVPVERVYSVFARLRIAKMFAGHWQRVANIEAYRKPYYHCKLTHCSDQNLKAPRPKVLQSGRMMEYQIRPATFEDVPEIAALCMLFSEESEPFVMTPSHALKEATLLVEHNVVFIHRARRNPEDAWSIASILATTRNTNEVGTITKVFTSDDWRFMGCAERLTHEVCRRFLAAGTKQMCLFVGIENPAKYVYHNVGFVGLTDDSPQVDGVEEWIEIGFDRRLVRVGHW